MLSTYQNIANALRKHAGLVQWIDIDKGQIEALQQQDDSYEIDIPALPAVFIGIPDEVWERQLTNKSQVGTGQLVVTLLLQLPSTLQASDPLIGMSVEALELADIVHEAILNVPEVMHRTHTRRLPVNHLYAVRLQYDVQTTYIRPIKTTPKPDPLITATIVVPISTSN